MPVRPQYEGGQFSPIRPLELAEIPDATTSEDGVMSAADKAKLNSLTPGGSKRFASLTIRFGLGPNGVGPALLYCNGGDGVQQGADLSLVGWKIMQLLCTIDLGSLGAAGIAFSFGPTPPGGVDFADTIINSNGSIAVQHLVAGDLTQAVIQVLAHSP